MAIRAKWSSSVVESLSAEADALFEQFKAQLQPRVAAGLLDGLRADTAEFLGKRVEAGNALNSLKNATKEQNAAIAHALAVLRPARAAVHATGTEEGISVGSAHGWTGPRIGTRSVWWSWTPRNRDPGV